MMIAAKYDTINRQTTAADLTILDLPHTGSDSTTYTYTYTYTNID